jgi:Ca-activated chloride channel family protein
MQGEKLTLVKQAVDAALDHLSDQDRTALVIFDQEVDVLHWLDAATPKGTARLRRMLRDVEAGGSTNLSGGWLAACQELSRDAADPGARLRRALLLTDGLANVGIRDVGQLAHHAHELRRRGIATTTVGVGAGFDEFLLSGMAEAGGGAFQYIAEPGELRAFFEREIGDLLEVVAIQPRLRLDLPYGMQARLINAFPSHRNGSIVDVDLRDFAQRDEVALVFEVTVAPGAEGSALTPAFSLTWTDPVTNRPDYLDSDHATIRRVSHAEVAAISVDAEMSEIVAMERAAREHREAIRLDREGRFEEARARFRHAGDVLAAAPQSVRVRQEHDISIDLAARASAPLDEHTRKQRVFESHRRSRGTRHRED